MLVLSLTAAALPWSLIAIRSSQSIGGTLDPVLYPGAAAWDQEASPSVPIQPGPAVAREDIVILADNGCLGWDPAEMAPDRCRYGAVDGEQRAVLVGDSHAARFMRPLDAVLLEQGFARDVQVRNGCPFNAAPLGTGGGRFQDCIERNRLTLDGLLADPPEMVFTSNLRPAGYERELSWTWQSREETVEGYRSMWQPLVDAGIDVRVIPDSPLPAEAAPECVSTTDSLAECSDHISYTFAQTLAGPSAGWSSATDGGYPTIGEPPVIPGLCTPCA